MLLLFTRSVEGKIMQTGSHNHNTNKGISVSTKAGDVADQSIISKSYPQVKGLRIGRADQIKIFNKALIQGNEGSFVA